VLAADWVTVDNAFRILGRVVARATREADQDAGKLGSAAKRELEFLREAAGRARTIVLPHTGTEKELVELTNVVKQQIDEELARQLDR
jgi:hypothetical protein